MAVGLELVLHDGDGPFQVIGQDLQRGMGKQTLAVLAGRGADAGKIGHAADAGQTAARIQHEQRFVLGVLNGLVGFVDGSIEQNGVRFVDVQVEDLASGILHQHRRFNAEDAGRKLGLLVQGAETSGDRRDAHLVLQIGIGQGTGNRVGIRVLVADDVDGFS